MATLFFLLNMNLHEKCITITVENNIKTILLQRLPEYKLTLILLNFLYELIQLQFLELSIINFGDIKMATSDCQAI